MYTKPERAEFYLGYGCINDFVAQSTECSSTCPRLYYTRYLSYGRTNCHVGTWSRSICRLERPVRVFSIIEHQRSIQYVRFCFPSYFQRSKSPLPQGGIMPKL